MMLLPSILIVNVFCLISVGEIVAKDVTRSPKQLSKLPFQFRIPRTGFTCKNRAPGYYADVRASCEVYHMCTERGGKQSFLCPPRTRFNQKTLVCDFKRNVKCSDSSEFFHKNVVLKERSKKKEPSKKEKVSKGNGKNLNKRPRLSNHFAKLELIEKKPQFIKTQGNGQMSFAPLFKQKSRHNLARILDISTLKQDRHKGGASINEISDQGKKKVLSNSPIIHISPPEPLTRLRQDPETPPSLNPFQIVGHVMSSKELVSFPDSPMVNISVRSDAQIGGGRPLSVANARSAKGEPRLTPGNDALGLPLQLKKLSEDKSPPLIWISPASLARSPMVNLRRLWDRNFPIRRTLTMSFPEPKRRNIHPLISPSNSFL